MGVGFVVLGLLSRPKTVSELWRDYRERLGIVGETAVGFDWFVLSIDLLYALGLVTWRDRLIERTAQ